MFTSLPSEPTFEEVDPVVVLHAEGFPASLHAAEADLFSRQSAMPGHDQQLIEAARLGIVGAGGLGSWIALAAARMGFRHITIMDGDRFDRTNAPRQVMFGDDLRAPKAHAVAKNVLPHMTNAGTVVGIARPFPDALRHVQETTTILIVGVDNNQARLDACAWGLAASAPVVFVMLSMDGMRAQAFLQKPNCACLRCVLPNLEEQTTAPCAAASIAPCLLAASHAIHLATDAIAGQALPTWREASLDGTADRATRPLRRQICRCSTERRG